MKLEVILWEGYALLKANVIFINGPDRYLHLYGLGYGKGKTDTNITVCYG